MKIDIEKIKQLREMSQLSIGDCKKALEETKGDVSKALLTLKRRGTAVLEKKSERQTKNGIVTSYIHVNGKVGSILELNCETDFVAKNAEFKKLAQELAIQVAGYNPKFVDRDSLDPEFLKNLTKEFEKEIDKKKPKNIQEQILQGKLRKYFEENSLLDEPYFRDESIKVKDLISQNIQKLDENIKVKRFIRFQI